MQFQQPAAAGRGAAGSSLESEERLRESVLLSAGAFRDAQLGGSPSLQQQQAGSSSRQRPATSPAASSGSRGGGSGAVRASLSPRGATQSPSASGGGGTIPEEDQQAQLAAMEQVGRAVRAAMGALAALEENVRG